GAAIGASAIDVAEDGTSLVDSTLMSDMGRAPLLEDESRMLHRDCRVELRAGSVSDGRSPVANASGSDKNETAAWTFKRRARRRRQSEVGCSAQPRALRRSALRTSRGLGLWPSFHCRLRRRAATPETIAAAQLVPVSSMTPPPGFAPTIRSP